MRSNRAELYLLLFFCVFYECLYAQFIAFEECERTASNCENDKEALLCHLRRAFSLHRYQPDCLNYFEDGMCESKKLRDAMKQSCRTTYYRYCDKHIYASRHGFTPEQPDYRGIQEDRPLEMYGHLIKVFEKYPCTTAIQTFGCFSKYSFLTAIDIAHYCPLQWKRLCKLENGKNVKYPYDQTFDDLKVVLDRCSAVEA